MRQGLVGTRHVWHRLPVLCCLLSALQGCAYLPLRQSALHAPAPLPAELAAYYEYPAHQHDAVSFLIRRRAAYSEYLVRFPLSIPQGLEPTEPVVEFEWFESHAPGRRGALVFNPILGGDYPVERGVCRTFARQGWHVALVHRKTLKISPEHELAHLERLLRQGLVRVRQVTDWVAAQDRVDPERLGGFGISMGGIAGIMAAAVEPRLKAHVIVLAGGPIAEILASSSDRMIRQPRSLYLARNRMEPQVMQQRLHEALRTDPIRLAPYVDPRRVFMAVALADRTIGRANALRLWRAAGRPQAVFMPFGHYSAYLALPYLERAGLQFLRRQLAAP